MNAHTTPAHRTEPRSTALSVYGDETARRQFRTCLFILNIYIQTRIFTKTMLKGEALTGFQHVSLPIKTNK